MLLPVEVPVKYKGKGVHDLRRPATRNWYVLTLGSPRSCCMASGVCLFVMEYIHRNPDRDDSVFQILYRLSYVAYNSA